MKYVAIIGFLVAVFSSMKFVDRQVSTLKSEAVEEITAKVDRKMRGDTVPCIYSFEVK